MPISHFHTGGAHRPRPQPMETAAQRGVRLAHERLLIEEARAEFRAGEALDEDEVEVWLDALDTDEDVPLPQPRAPGV